MQEEIIIIGAGPTGLMTAYELAKSGKRPLILEARDRIGGRSHTIYSQDGQITETGAEFIHGRLPLTLALLHEAGLSYTACRGSWIELRGGDASEIKDNGHWSALLKKLKELDEDMSLQDFLEQYFPESAHAAIKDRAVSYAEGYDSADASKASAKALYEEWSKADDQLYRIDKGYSALMEFLAENCRAAGCRIILSHPATAVTTDDRGVTVTAGGQEFRAAKVVVALPLGVLQQEPGIPFRPEHTEYRDALRSLGFGDVIKFLFRFRDSFWEAEYPGLGFLFASAPVHTWWTQAPVQSKLLSGWLAGRSARATMHVPVAQLREMALESLSVIFSIDRAILNQKVEDAHIVNWSNDPYTMGAYAYATVGSEKARSVLSAPMAERVFFAGEYMYSGPSMGTVEAALQSGKETATRLLASQHET